MEKRGLEKEKEGRKKEDKRGGILEQVVGRRNRRKEARERRSKREGRS